ncbi:M48 family metallopeptidase [Flocculibacter collagenilyticus]|uniref:M48 family metallopeptidase n=1 Tax=Flocculibacter collagenilyticus TaxID=2744479 RepID=UPI0018F6EC44|nr:M48 family metallopeptidase [Flocculibacter collagenilyticus]
MKHTQYLFIPLLSTVLLAGCAESPTGRKQLKLFSESNLQKMGVDAFDEMKESTKLSTNPKHLARANCVANSITAKVGKEVFNGTWEVKVFDDEQVNAFALPGGKIGIYTGLLKVAETNDQLAAVVGHEVGHVIAEHGNERMSTSAVAQMGLQVADTVLTANDVGGKAQWMSALGLGMQVGFTLPFSRTHESEADLIGLELMAKAGFNPKEAVQLWKNMDKAAGGKRPPELLSTHPAPQTRIEDLQKNMQPVLKIYKSAPKNNCA